MTKSVYAEDCVIEFFDVDASDNSVCTMTICEFIESNLEDFDTQDKKQSFVDTLLLTHRFDYHVAIFDSLEIRLKSIAFKDNETREIENIDV